MRRLLKTMYGTRGAPQIWSGEVRKDMGKLGFSTSVLNPSVFSKPTCEVLVIVHVGEFLCVGG